MLGATVPAIGGYYTGFKIGDEWGCDCIQIYITPSRTWNVPELSQDEIVKFKTAWKKSKVKQVVPHIPYLVNLASKDKVLWNKSVERLQVELSRADEFGVSLLVLHPGSYVNPVKCREAAILPEAKLFNRVNSTKQEGTERIILALNKVLEKYNGKTNPVRKTKSSNGVKILLETMAGQGTMIGSTFEELAYILSKVNRSQLVGVCFDTAHVFIAGYDIRGAKGYKKVLSEFDKIIGIEKIKVIHLNDSKTDLGMRVDRHACVGEGKIGIETFQAIMRDKRFKNIPKILEIPERDIKTKNNLELLRKLK